MATHAVSPGTRKNLALSAFLWVLQIGAALFLLSAAIPKLTGDPMMVQVFGAIGLGQWFRYLTGLLEVIGSIGLFIPRVTGYAALLLSAVMAGGVLTHLFILGGSPMAAFVLLVVNLVIAWGRLRRTA
jgi:putative oxidoreductase